MNKKKKKEILIEVTDSLYDFAWYNVQISKKKDI